MSRFIQLAVQDDTAIRDELASGLLAHPARVSPKHFYDALGSKLFEAICAVPEYYPTRTEAAIVQRYRGEIAEACGTGRVLIDLGAGNCEKAAALFDTLKPSCYVPLDISVEFLKAAVERLKLQHPQVDMLGVGIDFSSTLVLPEEVPSGRRLFFYPGSSIGNFTPAEALAFLQRLRDACGEDGQLLIGVDLLKDLAVLEAAYDDALGITACFNRNLLSNINRCLGSDFHLQDWRHVALFRREHSRIEMHLEALQPLEVRWPGASRRFEAGETIHTENSCKYSPEAFLSLLRAAGFCDVKTWTDERNWFMVCHASAG